MNNEGNIPSLTEDLPPFAEEGSVHHEVESQILSKKNRKPLRSYFSIGWYYISQCDYDLAEKWLWYCCYKGHKHAGMLLSILRYGNRARGEWERDESGLCLFSIRHHPEEKNREEVDMFCDMMDPTGTRAYRSILRILLQGSFDRNRSTSIYRSFFQSNLREIHLLSLITNFLISPPIKDKMTETSPPIEQDMIKTSRPIKQEIIENEVEEEYKTEVDIPSSHVQVKISRLSDILSLLHPSYSSTVSLSITITSPIGFNLSSLLPLSPCFPSISHLCIRPRYDRGSTSHDDFFFLSQFTSSGLRSLEVDSFGQISFFDLSPFLSIKAPSLSSLRFTNGGDLPRLDAISHLSHTLTDLYLNCRLLSLSPLSQSHFPLLETLVLRPISDTLQTLDGLTEQNTQSLKHLTIIMNEGKLDISSLSHLSLSNLSSLSLSLHNVSDLSPLLHCDFSLLEHLSISSMKVSDISPLLSPPPLSLQSLILNDTHFSDLSLLSCLNKKNLKQLEISSSPYFSDLSLLVEWSDFSPTTLRFSNNKILKDISPLSLLDLSSITDPIDLHFSPISDISCLEVIARSDLMFHMMECPIEGDVGEECSFRLGNVTVWTEFDWG